MAHHHPTMDTSHSGMDHSMMNHTGMDNITHHTGMVHNTMDHNGMDHNGMDHNGMDHNGMDQNGMNHTSMCHMMMYFNTDLGSYILFEDLKANTITEMASACFAIFAVSILYEGLKFVREHLLRKSIQAVASGRYLANGASPRQVAMETGTPSVSNRMLSYGHFIQTALHILQVFVSYCLMLVVMTYNVWLCLAVVLGAGVGYFLFGWKRAVIVDNNEHCH